MTRRVATALASVLLSLNAAAAFARDDEPLDPPIAKFEIGLEQELYGQCANITVDRKGQAPLVRWTNICHGWRTFSCADHILLVELGIKTDRAILIFEGDNRTGDPMALIGKAIARKWPGNEILDLNFGNARCDEGTFLLPFDGSHVPSKGGSGHAMRGRVTFRSADNATVTFDPATINRPN